MSTYRMAMEGAQVNFPGGCGARLTASTMKDTATSATGEARTARNIQERLMGPLSVVSLVGGRLLLLVGGRRHPGIRQQFLVALLVGGGLREPRSGGGGLGPARLH